VLEGEGYVWEELSLVVCDVVSVDADVSVLSVFELEKLEIEVSSDWVDDEIELLDSLLSVG
jgi:hypothetical protein